MQPKSLCVLSSPPFSLPLSTLAVDGFTLSLGTKVVVLGLCALPALPPVASSLVPLSQISCFLLYSYTVGGAATSDTFVS